MANTYPKLHNAGWPGLVGKGEDSEPFIDLETMIDLTAAAEVDGQKERKDRKRKTVSMRSGRLLRRETADYQAGPEITGLH